MAGDLTHSGYLGRFAIDIPLHQAGELIIELQDQVRDVDSRGSMEDFPHTTLQGADEGGWGINSLGLPGEVRLRLVRHLYLQAAYATTIARQDSRNRLRIGTKVDAVSTPASAQFEIRVFDAEKSLIATHQEAWNPNNKGEQLIEFDVEGLTELGLGATRSYSMVNDTSPAAVECITSTEPCHSMMNTPLAPTSPSTRAFERVTKPPLNRPPRQGSSGFDLATC